MHLGIGWAETSDHARIGCHGGAVVRAPASQRGGWRLHKPGKKEDISRQHISKEAGPECGHSCQIDIFFYNIKFVQWFVRYAAN